MFKQFILSSLLVLGALSGALPSLQQQQPMNENDISSQKSPKTVDLIQELQTAQVIPDVLNSFDLKIRLSITWPNVSADIGNEVNVSAVQETPVIEAFLPKGNDDPIIGRETRIVVALTDPDAPSREDPEWSQICHWVVYGVRVQSHAGKKEMMVETRLEESAVIDYRDDYEGDQEQHEPTTALSNKNKSKKQHDMKHHDIATLIPYKPPGPPPKTGKHRYVFVAMTPANGSTGPLYPSIPQDRQHWGYGDSKERLGVREWMAENGLVVIGANFVYAQNEEQ